MSTAQERPVRDREVYLSARRKQLRLSGRQATEVRGHQPAEPHPPLPLHPEALSGLFAERAMHARKISHSLHPHLRGSTTTRLRGGENPRLRSVPARATESRSALCRTEEPDRLASSAPAPNEVRTRAV